MNIIDKVKKLLALANSTNEHEANLASQRAMELMTKHNIAMADVSDKQYSHENGSTKKRAAVSDRWINALLNEFFFITVVEHKLRDGIKFTYWGTPENVEIALYVRDYLTFTFNSLAKANGIRYRKDYFSGLYRGLRRKLLDSQKKISEETGLVIVKDSALRDFIQSELNGSLKNGRFNHKPRDYQAINQGMSDGQNINIRRGVSESSSNGLKLLK